MCANDEPQTGATLFRFIVGVKEVLVLGAEVVEEDMDMSAGHVRVNYHEVPAIPGRVPQAHAVVLAVDQDLWYYVTGRGSCWQQPLIMRASQQSSHGQRLAKPGCAEKAAGHFHVDQNPAKASWLEHGRFMGNNGVIVIEIYWGLGLPVWDEICLRDFAI